MHRHGVERYVGNATPSVLDPQETGTWQTRLPATMARTLLSRTDDELTRMTTIVMDSCMDWTIVRFLAPQHGPATGTVRSGFSGTDTLGPTITRADSAAFTAAQIDDPR